MKKFINNIRAKIRNAQENITSKAVTRIYPILSSTRAEAYVDTGVKILIAVVIGALLLALLYTLFNTTIMPTVTTRVQELFTYNG